MTHKPLFFFSLVIIVALAFRLPGLSVRTMHGDEAVNAIKFAQLLEKGSYYYDPAEYHGPVLYYLTLPLTFVSQKDTLQDLDEVTLRVLPLIFCTGLLFLLVILKNELGIRSILLSASFLAISPAFVFYSRYYIHEMLFVFFCYAVLITAFKLWQKPSLKLAALFGALLAMMMASKETWIIAAISAAGSLALLLLIYPSFRRKFVNRLSGFVYKHYLVFGISFVFFYGILFSSFLKNPAGIWDSVLSIFLYSEKSVAGTIHDHPWYQYLAWLISAEGLIFLPALAGIFYSFRSNKNLSDKSLFFIRFIAFFSIMSIIIFSVILYKTPWNALVFWAGMILLAGSGLHMILGSIRSKSFKIISVMLASALCIQVGWQSYRLNFTEYEDPDNPYVYAQPQKDIFRILDALHLIAERHKQGKQMYIQVIVKNNDYWPLPWYLRDFTKTGWWDRVDMTIPSADFIIASPDMETKLVYKFYEMTEPGKHKLYISLFPDNINIRPGVPLTVFVTLSAAELMAL